MHSFTDTRGRKWAVELSIGVMRRIKDTAKVDLANINDESFAVLAADNLTLCGILDLCTRVVSSNGVPETVPLEDTLAGDALGQARSAFTDELLSFFPSERERAAFARMKQTLEAAKSRAFTLMEQEVESGRLDRVIDEAMAEAVQGSSTTHGESSGSSPASLELIPPG